MSTHGQGAGAQDGDAQDEARQGGGRREEDKPLADRRAEAGAPQDTEADFADEHTPSPTDPPIAEAETPGGEDEGYSPQTEVP